MCGEIMEQGVLLRSLSLVLLLYQWPWPATSPPSSSTRCCIMSGTIEAEATATPSANMSVSFAHLCTESASAFIYLFLPCNFSAPPLALLLIHFDTLI